MKHLLFSFIIILSISSSYAQNTDSVKLAAEKKVICLCCGKSDSTKKVMYIIDGKIFMANKLISMDPQLIKNITVLRGNEAKLKYGDSAQNGALIIDIKKEGKWVAVSDILNKNKVKGENLKLPVFFNNGPVNTELILINRKSKYKVSVLTSAKVPLKDNTYSGNYLSIFETKGVALL
jgi:hypothetical protein